ncbi:hypothetical protein Avbf_09161 [Armadillidium vulgare]|nr:hypothetical protein Avbf_09161 [Armadillidium vulgare]
MIKLLDVSSLTTSGTNTAKPLPKKRVRKPSTKAKESPPCKKAKTKEVVKKVMIKEAVTKSSPAAARKKAQAPPIKPNQVPSMESHVFATHLYPVNPPLLMIRGEAKDKTFHCTPACEAGGGNVPNLQCVKCNCYREESTTKTYLEPFKPSIAFEPLAFDPSSDSEDEGLVSGLRTSFVYTR